MTTTELAGIAHELKFWKGFVNTPRFLDGWVRNIKTPELRQETYDFIKSVPHKKVLDVGSGVCSILNGTVPGVITMDPLGELYQLIFDYKKSWLVPPLPIPAEELQDLDLYDIVHISNAIDHTQDPVAAIRALFRAVKPGGYLIIQGFENEGSFEKWQGFHKWNFFIDENELCMSDQEVNVERLINNPTKLFRKQLDNKNWYIWIQQKQ